jgi:hypothetical protein
MAQGGSGICELSADAIHQSGEDALEGDGDEAGANPEDDGDDDDDDEYSEEEEDYSDGDVAGADAPEGVNHQKVLADFYNVRLVGALPRSPSRC